MNKIKIFAACAFSALLGWFGWNTYQYFFITTAPEVSIAGLAEGGCYAGDMICKVMGTDAYKVSTISLHLDESPLLAKYPISKNRFEHSFTIPTRSLPNGKHTVVVQAQSGSYAGAHSEKKYEFTVDNTPLYAAFIKSDAEQRVFQGRTFHIQFQANKEIKSARVHALSEEYDAFPEANKALIYEAFIPVSCEEKPNEYLYTIDIVDKVGNTVKLENKFQVVVYPFKKQFLKVDSAKVQEEKEIGIPQEQFEERMKQLTIQSPKQKLWSGLFYPPIEITAVSTEFGTVRTTQEKGRYAHKGVDVINLPRSVVWAPADGIVVVKDRYVHSGNTIAIDHGFGIISLFFHLDSFADIKEGESVKRGNPIGTLGKTGYASGYHLHWELRINNIQVDPLQWIKSGF